MSTLVASIGVLAERYVLMLGIHHTDLALRPVLQRTLGTLGNTVNHIVESFTEEHFMSLLPFKEMQRAEVIKTGRRLGVNSVNTWSCHESRDVPCKKCEGCAERRDAFALAQVHDPQLDTAGFAVPVRANSVPFRK